MSTGDFIFACYKPMLMLPGRSRDTQAQSCRFRTKALALQEEQLLLLHRTRLEQVLLAVERLLRHCDAQACQQAKIADPRWHGLDKEVEEGMRCVVAGRKSRKKKIQEPLESTAMSRALLVTLPYHVIHIHFGPSHFPLSRVSSLYYLGVSSVLGIKGFSLSAKDDLCFPVVRARTRVDGGLKKLDRVGKRTGQKWRRKDGQFFFFSFQKVPTTMLVRQGLVRAAAAAASSRGQPGSNAAAGIVSRAKATSAASAGGRGSGVTGKPVVSSGPSSSATTTAAVPSSMRNRKLTPTAKAKAQASASRALREQLSAVRGASAAPSALRAGQFEEVLAQGSSAEAKEGSEQEQQLRMLASALELSHTLIAPSTATPKQPQSGLYHHRLRDVVAYATAEGYDFEALIESGRLPDGWQLLEDDEVLYIPSWPRPASSSSSSAAAAASQSGGGGDAFIFRSGSYVTWGMTEDQSRRFLRAVIRSRSTSASAATKKAMSLAAERSSARRTGEVEIGPYDEIGDEAMEYLVADDQVTRVVGDVIVMGQAPTLDPKEDLSSGNEEAAQSSSSSSSTMADASKTMEETSGQDEEPPSWTPLLARLAFSQGLARSARLSVQESALTAYLEEVASVPGRLEAAGKVPMHRREVIRKMGTLLRLRQRANLDTENFLDDPEVSRRPTRSYTFVQC